MWLNKNEEKTFDPFIKYIYENENKNFRFLFEDGLELIVALHLYEFESDNGLDSKDPKYEEYWEMAFEIIEIKSDNLNKYSVGDKVLVNYHNIPKIYEAI